MSCTHFMASGHHPEIGLGCCTCRRSLTPLSSACWRWEAPRKRSMPARRSAARLGHTLFIGRCCQATGCEGQLTASTQAATQVGAASAAGSLPIGLTCRMAMWVAAMASETAASQMRHPLPTSDTNMLSGQICTLAPGRHMAKTARHYHALW